MMTFESPVDYEITHTGEVMLAMSVPFESPVDYEITQTDTPVATTTPRLRAL